MVSGTASGRQARQSYAQNMRSLDDDYLELLQTGSSSGEERRLEEDEVEDWLMLVAEPWWDGIGARAERDGIRVELYRGWGLDGSQSPAAVLLRPDGSHYPPNVTMWKWPFTRRQDRKRERAFLADWGDLLVNARASAAGG
jgi:hypothetical protein